MGSNEEKNLLVSSIEENLFFDRDISWLSFNYRVLLEAQKKNVPLLERLRFIAMFTHAFRNWDTQLFLYQSGSIPEEVWQSTRNTIAMNINFPGYRNLWKQEASLFTQSFRDLITEILLEEKNIHDSRTYFSEGQQDA